MSIAQKEFEGLLESKPQWKEWMASSIHKSLADYNNPHHYSPAVRTAHNANATARAINRNAQILYHARECLVDLPDIRECPQGNRQFFILSDQIRLSYKMLDKNLRPKNYPTGQSIDFMAQRLHLPEKLRQVLIPELTLFDKLSNLVVGYRFTEHDKTESSYEIYVVCPKGRFNAWKLPIYTGAVVTELFSPVVTESVSSGTEHTVIKRRVRVRKVGKEQNTDEQSIASEQSE